MTGNPLLGARYLLRGFSLLRRRELRAFVLVPLLVNIIVFSALIGLTVWQLGHGIELLLGWLPAWLDFLSWVLWPLALLLILVVAMYSFSVVANLIAAPFNGLLAEKVEKLLTGHEPPAGVGIAGLVADAPRAIGKEGRKLLYYLPRALGVLIVTLVPPANVVAPLLWFALGAWMLALEYFDYPMDNHRYTLPQVRERMGRAPLTALGFGTAALAGTMVPLLNLLIMPAAVCGATLYWVEQLEGRGDSLPAHR